MNKRIIFFAFLALFTLSSLRAQEPLAEGVGSFSIDDTANSSLSLQTMDSHNPWETTLQSAPVTGKMNSLDIHGALGFRMAFPNGIQFSTAFSLLPELTARAGFSFFSIALFNRDIAWQEIHHKSENQPEPDKLPDLRTSVKFSNFQGLFLVDYHPFKNWFRLTGGFFLGRMKFKSNITLIDHKTKEPISLDNEILDPASNGTIILQDDSDSSREIVFKVEEKPSLELTLNFGRIFQPYLGIGGGYSVPKTPISFVWDLGFVVAGKPRLYSPNVVRGDLNSLLDYSKEAQVALYRMQILPVANLGISVRLF